MKKISALILMMSQVAMAEVSTEDLIPDDSITTESEGIYIYPAPKEQAVETPNMDVEIQPAPPLLDYNNFPTEKVATLKALELAWHIKKGLISADAKLRFLGSKRDVHEDLKLYSDSIKWHVRAIQAGLDVNHFIEYIKAGKTPEEQSARMAVLVRDAELCGYGFALYADNNEKCSRFPDQLTAERHYRASLDTIDERDATISWLNSINADLAKQLDASNSLVVKLQSQIKKLKIGKR